MNLQLLADKLQSTWQREGWTGFVRRSAELLRRTRQKDDFDRQHGTDTGGVEPLWRFDIHSPNAALGERYQATDAQELMQTLRSLGVDLRPFCFVDLGCGKGRTLLVAARCGFRQLIGVEFAPELVVTARNNLARTRTPNASVVHADAALFDFPDGDLVVYLYNPFGEAVLRHVVDKLGRTCGGRLYVVYKTPRCAGVLDTSGYLVPLGAVDAAANTRVWTRSAASHAR